MQNVVCPMGGSVALLQKAVGKKAGKTAAAKATGAKGKKTKQANGDDALPPSADAAPPPSGAEPQKKKARRAAPGLSAAAEAAMAEVAAVDATETQIIAAAGAPDPDGDDDGLADDGVSATAREKLYLDDVWSILSTVFAKHQATDPNRTHQIVF